MVLHWPSRRSVGPLSNSKADNIPEAPLITESCSEARVTTGVTDNSDGSGHDDADENEELISAAGCLATSNMENITDGELWYELEKELHRQENKVDVEAEEEEAAAAQEIAEESESRTSISSSDVTESHHFYPPGRIMHIVTVASSDTTTITWTMTVPSRRNELVYTRHQENCTLKSGFQERWLMIAHMYKKMMELLISELKHEAAFHYATVQEE